MIVDLPNHDDPIKCLGSLNKYLNHIAQREINWLYNNTTTIVADNYQPETREEIQDRLHNASAALSILYLFALFETYFPRFHPDDKDKTDDRWKRAFAPMRLETLLAYRHIRHTVAHGFNGHRATNHRQQFDKVMKENPLPGIAHYDNDSIWLRHTAGLDCVAFLDRAAQYGLASIANGKIVDWQG